MKKAIACLGLAGLFFFAASTQLHFNQFTTLKSQIKGGMVPPLSLCGSPGARTILKIMDTTQQMAPLLTNLGDYAFIVSTTNQRAQLFFNQGINLYYGFNHLEAFRSFKEVARLDPQCAMAYWGQALSLGPNINLPMDPADTKTVYDAVQKSLSLISNASPKEQALIKALSMRYTKEALEDRKPLDQAYADEMERARNQFSDDLDVATLSAEAMMDLHPWDYWKDYEPQPWTNETVNLLAKVIATKEDHPGANHLNIHILEASPNPDAAAASADRLRYLVPGAGHLVHMPSHIYIRVGRYIEGVEANERAVKTDMDYITQCNVQGVYPLLYYPHNYHFLLACAQMAGMEKKSMATALELQKNVPVELMNVPDFVTFQHWYVMPWYTMVRFGNWNDIMKIPKPADSLLYVNAAWHYVRGTALTRMHKVKEATDELTQLKELVALPAMANMTIAGFNSFEKVLSIGRDILEGELLAEQKNYAKAIPILKSAVTTESRLLYQEPPDWFMPSRQVLGSVLLEAKKPKEAEENFREDLKLYRDNGWSLLGLAQSLEAQGNNKEAAEVRKKLTKAFTKSDVKPKTARF